MRDILVITPTRGRPEGARRLAAAVAQTAEAQTDLILAVDEDDSSYTGIQLDGSATFIHGPRATCGVWTNRLAAEYGSRYRALASFGDDHVPLTPGWDAKLLAAIDAMGGTGIAYGDDTAQHDFLPTAPVISSDIVASLGWMFLPSMGHYFCDNAWKDIGQGAGCLRYVPEVIIQHMHWAWGTASWDSTYVEAYREFGPDEQKYRNYVSDPAGLAADIEKVRRLRSRIEG